MARHRAALRRRSEAVRAWACSWRASCEPARVANSRRRPSSAAVVAARRASTTRAIPATAAASSSQAPATVATSSWPTAVGVPKCRWATSSATVRSPVCPMPVHTGTRAVATALATGGRSNTSSDALAPPPRTTTARSTSAGPEGGQGGLDGPDRGRPLDGDRAQRHIEGEAAALELAHEVTMAVAAGAGHHPDPQGQPGQHQPAVGVEEVVGDQRLHELPPGPQAVADQRVDVDILEDEGELAGVADLQAAGDHQALPDPQLHAGLGQLALDPVPPRRRAAGLEVGVAPVTAPAALDQLQPAGAGAGQPGQLADGPDRAPELLDHGQAGPAVEVADRPRALGRHGTVTLPTAQAADVLCPSPSVRSRHSP